jgi:uncharacterized SAM-binding protein YcdF (DUF218 family)
MSWLSYSSLVPPNVFIVLTVIGLVLAWRWTRLGLIVATFGGAPLYLASTPVVADYLIESVKDLAGAVPVLSSDAPPGAIIVLSADYRKSDTPGQSFTVGPMTLERLAEAARQERRLGLPVLVSGGTPEGIDDSLAQMMSTVLFEFGRAWTTEYGSAENPKDFTYLVRYSPYQNVKPGTKFPAIMFFTGDSDTRVDPLHARKMTALMQAATGGDRPILLHYSLKGGHSAGISVSQLVEDQADELAFLWNETGVNITSDIPK